MVSWAAVMSNPGADARPTQTPTAESNPGTQMKPATPGPGASAKAEGRAYGKYCKAHGVLSHARPRENCGILRMPRRSLQATLDPCGRPIRLLPVRS